MEKHLLKHPTVKNIRKFLKTYTAVSTVDPDGCDEFRTNGCDTCHHGLAASVYEIQFLAYSDIKKKVFDRIYYAHACGNCLCAMVNDDYSGFDLDFNSKGELL